LEQARDRLSTLNLYLDGFRARAAAGLASEFVPLPRVFNWLELGRDSAFQPARETNRNDACGKTV
jgi:hypothetical protein